MQIMNGIDLRTLSHEGRSNILSAYHIQPKEHIRILSALGHLSWNNEWRLGIAENHVVIKLFRDIAKDYGSRRTGTKSTDATNILKKDLER